MNKLVRIVLFAVIFVILSFLGSVIISFIFYDRPIGFLLNFILFVMVLVASIHVSENIYNTFKEMNTIREMMTVMTTIVFVIAGLNVLVPFFEEPPTPIIKAGNIKIPVVKGSYCWEGKKCVDRLYEDPLDMAKEQKPTVVAPNEEVEIGFRLGRMAESLEVEQWIDQDNIKNMDLDNHSMMVPKEKGIYVYHVLASWEQGDGDYTFSIEVQ